MPESKRENKVDIKLEALSDVVCTTKTGNLLYPKEDISLCNTLGKKYVLTEFFPQLLHLLIFYLDLNGGKSNLCIFQPITLQLCNFELQCGIMIG